jgi:hypothetical protein
LEDKVWEMGTQIRLNELFAMGKDLNRYKEQHRKYANFEQKLHMSEIFAIYKPVVSLIPIGKAEMPHRDDRYKDESEVEAAAEREKAFRN